MNNEFLLLGLFAVIILVFGAGLVGSAVYRETADGLVVTESDLTIQEAQLKTCCMQGEKSCRVLVHYDCGYCDGYCA